MHRESLVYYRGPFGSIESLWVPCGCLREHLVLWRIGFGFVNEHWVGLSSEKYGIWVPDGVPRLGLSGRIGSHAF